MPAEVASPFVQYVLPAIGQVLSALLFGRSQKKADKATDAQANLANVSADIFRQQSAIDLPYRATAMDALLRRSKQQFPRILPTSPGTALNPLSGGQQPQYPMSGVNSAPPQRDFQSILRALTAGRR